LKVRDLDIRQIDTQILCKEPVTTKGQLKKAGKGIKKPEEKFHPA
jgi:hypothetical protein